MYSVKSWRCQLCQQANTSRLWAELRSPVSYTKPIVWPLSSKTDEWCCDKEFWLALNCNRNSSLVSFWLTKWDRTETQWAKYWSSATWVVFNESLAHWAMLMIWVANPFCSALACINYLQILCVDQGRERVNIVQSSRSPCNTAC